MKCAVCFLSLLLSVFVINVESARILGLFTTWSPSHLIIEMATINTLVTRGHDVTVVTTLPLNYKNPKFHHIKLATHVVRKNFFNDLIESEKNFWIWMSSIKNLLEYGFESSNSSLNHPNMKKLLREESFDAVVMGYFLNDFQMGVAAHFKCPLILIDTHKSMQLTNGLIGNPLETVYVPAVLSPRVQPLIFFERLENFLLNSFEALLFTIVYKPRVEAYYEYNFPSDKYPPFEEIKKNVSLILHTSHFSEGLIRPNVPAFIEIAGIQSKSKPDPLPEDIKKMLDSAGEYGAIYFSLGSNAQSAELDPKIMSIVYNVLSGLKQSVIWKWEDDNVPGNSSNILFKKWLPQDDILAHRNTKLFISHAGLGSIAESQYHGVPIVGMPLFADQFKIMNAAVDAGFGVIVDYFHMTEEALQSAVFEVLNNPKYRNVVKQFSNIYRDRPMSPQDTAAFWMEYVIRHRGAKHMQSPAVHMNNIQIFGLDVLVFIIAVIYIGYKVIVLLSKILFFKFCRRKSLNDKSERSKIE